MPQILLRYSQMEKLDLSNKKVNDAAAVHLGSCLHNVRKLELYNCDLTQQGIEVLAKSIQQLEKPVNKYNVDVLS